MIAKPDQLIKRRGKLGLIKIKTDLHEAQGWIKEKMASPFKIGNTQGKLRNFIIEPFVPHTDEEEMYCAIYSTKTGDRVLFYHQGGVDIGDVDAKAAFIDIEIDQLPDKDSISSLLGEVNCEKSKELISEFLIQLFQVYRDLYFTYMEINPLVVKDGKIFILDLAAKIDQVNHTIVYYGSNILKDIG